MTDNNNMMIVLDGQPLSEGGYHKIKLTINKETEIVNGLDGTKLFYDDTK